MCTGSLSRTGVSVDAGARSRWAGILAVIAGMQCVIGTQLITDRVADL